MASRKDRAARYVTKSLTLVMTPFSEHKKLKSDHKSSKITATKFKYVLKKEGHHPHLQVCHMFQINDITIDVLPAVFFIHEQYLTSENNISPKRISVICDDLPVGISSAREVDQSIMTLDSAMLSHRTLSRLFFFETRRHQRA